MSDYDSPWKEILEEYLEACFALLFPTAYAAIDWSRGFELMDKEFQQIVPQSEVGRRYVDKLIKVWLRGGQPVCLLIHIEVQTQRESDFPRRMFVYNYRVYDRFDMVVVSFAILADEEPNWRPNHFEYGAFGSTCGLTFPAVKLWDWVGRENVLEQHDNPFDLVILAHLRALQTRNDPANRLNWKTYLVRRLYERGMTTQDVWRLLRFIDWLRDLPPMLQSIFHTDVERLQEEKKMPFMTTFERIGRQQALKKGIREFLTFRFGSDGQAVLTEIETLLDHELLERILDAIGTVDRPEQLRRFWESEPATSDSTGPTT